MFEKIYTHENWRPDMIKIYPCVVNKNAKLYRLYRAGRYRPYTAKQLLDLIVKIKKITPPWVRITRLIRDIPTESIAAGNKITNLRQLIAQQAALDNWQCQCLRCREAGHQTESAGRPQLFTASYRANSGTEYFLQFASQTQKILYAFLRLRLNDNAASKNAAEQAAIKKNKKTPAKNPAADILPELRGAALVRELHTYGAVAAISVKGAVQHLGLGRRLLKEAEKIARRAGARKVAIIAGVGVRQYYEKFGYGLAGTYMVKLLAGKNPGGGI